MLNSLLDHMSRKIGVAKRNSRLSIDARPPPPSIQTYNIVNIVYIKKKVVMKIGIVGFATLIPLKIWISNLYSSRYML